jgi:hypothetical protein
MPAGEQYIKSRPNQIYRVIQEFCVFSINENMKEDSLNKGDLFILISFGYQEAAPARRVEILNLRNLKKYAKYYWPGDRIELA